MHHAWLRTWLRNHAMSALSLLAGRDARGRRKSHPARPGRVGLCDAAAERARAAGRGRGRARQRPARPAARKPHVRLAGLRGCNGGGAACGRGRRGPAGALPPTPTPPCFLQQRLPFPRIAGCAASHAPCCCDAAVLPWWCLQPGCTSKQRTEALGGLEKARVTAAAEQNCEHACRTTPAGGRATARLQDAQLGGRTKARRLDATWLHSTAAQRMHMRGAGRVMCKRRNTRAPHVVHIVQVQPSSQSLHARAAGLGGRAERAPRRGRRGAPAPEGRDQGGLVAGGRVARRRGRQEGGLCARAQARGAAGAALALGSGRGWGRPSACLLCVL